MKPCYEGLKEITVDVNEIWRKIFDFGVSIGLLPLILIVMSCEMKPCYEGLKEIGVDVNEIWRKMLCFRVSIGLLTPYFDCLVKWNPLKVWKRSWCQWDMKENVRFRSKYRVFTPYLDCIVKWNPVMKVWKKSELMSMRYERNQENMRENVRFRSKFRVVTPYFYRLV